MDDSSAGIAALNVFCKACEEVDTYFEGQDFPEKPTSWLTVIDRGALNISGFEVKTLKRYYRDFWEDDTEYVIHLYQDNKVVATVTASFFDFTFYNGIEDGGDNILFSESGVPSVSDIKDIVVREGSARVAVALGVLCSVMVV